MAEKDPSQGRRWSPWSILSANLALAATLLAFLTVAVRAFAVARLDPTTAVVLVQTTGPVNVFVGTLTSAVPSLVALGFILFMYGQERATSRRKVALVVTAATGVLMVFIAPTILFVAWLALAAFSAMQGNRNDRGLKSMLIVMAAIAAASWAGSFLLLSRPWLPLEAIEVRGSAVVVGYVLEEEGQWVSVLDDRTREISFVKQVDLASRQPCTDQEGTFGPSLAYVVAEMVDEAPRQPSYPLCDEVIL